jgi:hypothetical protein
VNSCASSIFWLIGRRALTFFTSLVYEPCYAELCQRRDAFFFQHCTLIGLAGAQAVSLRMGGNTLSFADFIGWTWTIYILIFPSNKILFKAFYVYVYVYVCMYVSLWLSEP